MSEEPKWFVGQDVFVMGHNSMSPGKISYITPSGRLRLEGSKTNFDAHGHHRPKNGWMSDSVWLQPSTPKLVAEHLLNVRRATVRGRIKRLADTEIKSASMDELEAVLKLVTEAVNILNNSKSKVAS